MILDRSEYPVIAYLEACHARIRAEWQRVPPERVLLMPYPGLFLGEWHYYLVHHHDSHPENHALGLRNQELVPETRGMIQQIPGLFMGAWLRLGPGSRILPHRDELDYFRFHLPMDEREGSWIRVGEQRVEHRRGRCVGFDPCLEHEAANDGPLIRDHFVVDVQKARAREPLPTP